MRDITETLRVAIEDKATYKNAVKLRFRKNRTYFMADDLTDNSPAWAQGSGVSEQPIPQSVHYVDGKLLTLVSKDDEISYFWQGDSTERTIAISQQSTGRVALFGDYLFCADTSGNIKRHLVSVVDGVIAIVSSETIATLANNVSLSALSESEVVAFYVDEGGVRATYYSLDGTWGSSSMPVRFMHPYEIVTDDYWSNFSAAVLFNGNVYAYQSMNDGATRCCVYNKTSLSWTDIAISVAADLSRFLIGNAIATDVGVHLSGQFVRTENLDSGYVFNMVLSSKDGVVFALDRSSMVSRSGNRFLIAEDGTNLYVSSFNKTISFSMTGKFSNTTAYLEVSGDDIIDIGIVDQVDSGITVDVSLRAGDEKYFDSEYVARGNIVTVYFGYLTSVGNEYIALGDFFVDEVEMEWGDGDRYFSLALTNLEMWKLKRIPSPLYTEIVGQSFIYDDANELDNLYIGPKSGLGNKIVPLHFWDCEPFEPDETVEGVSIIDTEDAGPLPYEAIGSHKYGIKCKDIYDMYFNPYPEAVGTSVEVWLYGWSKTKTAGAHNDEILAYIEVEYEDDEGEVIDEWIEANSTLSEYSRLPQYYINAEVGSYPIKWDFVVQKNYKIKNVGFVLEQSTDTIFMPERAELRGTSYSRDDAYGNTPWDSENDTISLTRAGRPFVMLSVKPYSAFEFSAMASFERDGGKSPNRFSTYCGVIGLAEDGSNFVAARYLWQQNQIQIIKVRNNSVTVLASSFVKVHNTNSLTLCLESRGGVLGVKTRVDGCWSPPILIYEWKASDGPMSTSSDDIMHVGILGEIDLPKFNIIGFDLEDSDGIGIAPDIEHYVLRDFPSAGSVRIRDNVYSYGRKSSVKYDAQFIPYYTVFGPYPCVQQPDGDEVDGKIVCAYTRYSETEFNSVKSYEGKGYLLCVKGENYELGLGSLYSASWKVNNECDFFTKNIIAWSSYNNAAKLYITRGLLDIKRVEGEIYSHSDGEMCTLFTTEKITLTEFAATNLSTETTIKDMIRRICANVGATAVFSGDKTETLTLSESEQQI